MRRRTLTPRDRRALIVGGLLIVLGLGWFRVVPALRTWSAEGTAAAREMQQAVARAYAVLEAMPVVSETMEIRARQMVDLAPMVFGGQAGSGASLASHVGLAARDVGLRLGSVTILPDTGAVARDGTFRRIQVSGAGHGDIRGVTRFVAALETGIPLTFFRSLSIEQPEPGADPSHPERLRIAFVVEAIALAGGTS